MRHTVCVATSLCRCVDIPCPTKEVASTIQQVIGVDKELRPHDVHKSMCVEDATDGAVLHVYVRIDSRSTMRATTLRPLRLALNSFLEDSALIVRTMDTLRPGSTCTSSDVLEHGSVGLAG